MNRFFGIDAFKRLAGSVALPALLALSLGLQPACGNSTSGVDSGLAPDAGPDAGPFSICGYPGDVGINDAGIGQYCSNSGQCPFTAPLCSSINNLPAKPELDTYFCVLPCDECDATDFCGAGATCVCQSPHNCGCTPNACSNIFPDGGTPPYPGYPMCDAG